MSERGDLIAETARSFVGCSLKKRREELALLTSCGVDDPARVVQIKTNCAMFARGVMKRVGVVHPILEAPYRDQRAVSDVLEIAKRHGALEPFREGTPIKRGSILHYSTPGMNNDHIECATLEDASEELGWSVRHCGGGRADNAITEARTDIRWSSGRRLQHVIDPDLLLEPV